MSIVRKDTHGLYVRAGGYTARPGNVCGYDHAYRMDDAGLMAGDHVKARHIPGDTLVKIVAANGIILHWHTGDTIADDETMGD